MKAFFLVITLAASSAFAAKFPVIYQSIGGVPVNNLCDAGDVFKTINPVTRCTEMVETPAVGQGEYVVPAKWTCVASETTHLEVSKETVVCARMVVNESELYCAEFTAGTQSSTVIAEENIKAIIKDNLRVIYHTIPTCQSL